MATHRISVDVSSEEGVMYAGVPARWTREYEQWTPTPSVNQLVLSTPVNWYTIAPCMQQTYTLSTLGTFVVTQSDCRLICLSYIFKGVI